MGSTSYHTPENNNGLMAAGHVAAAISALTLPLVTWFNAPTVLAWLVVGVFLLCNASGWVALAVRNFHFWLLFTPVLSFALLILTSMLSIKSSTWAPATWMVAAALFSGIGAVLALTTIPTSSSLPSPPDSATGMNQRLTLGVCAGVITAWVLWIFSVVAIDLDQAGARGILDVLPVTYYLAVLAATASFAATFHPKVALATPVRICSVLVLVACMTQTVNLADWGAQQNVAYIHIGFIDAIAQRGDLMTANEARFSWPGFFAAFALAGSWISRATISELFLPVVVVYPAIIVTLWLAPIWTIARALTGSARVAWLALPIFVGINWVGQDYFSPQSFALLTYTTIVAVLLELRRQAAPQGRFRLPDRPAGWSAGRFLRVEALIVIMICALVMSHQLTPVLLIAVLFLFAVTRNTRYKELWVIAGVVFAGWFVLGAQDWWTNHLTILTEGFGQPVDALQDGVSGRVRGDATYVAMQHYRIIYTGLIALLAAVGWFLSLRHNPVAGAATILGSVFLVFGQTYGGEVVLRVFLYASPIFAAYAAQTLALVVRRLKQPLARHAACAIALTLIVTGGTVARGVNVSYERTPHDVVEAAQYLQDIAPEGSTVQPLFLEGALQTGRRGELNQPLPEDEQEAEVRDVLGRVVKYEPDYVFLSTSQQAYQHLLQGEPADWKDITTTKLERDGSYAVRLRTEHAVVLERINAESRKISDETGVMPPEVRADFLRERGEQP